MRIPLWALALTVLSQTASAETLRSTERSITAKYPDGQVERYVAVYVGNVNVSANETGHPAEPFNGWFSDTRQCQWNIESFVQRTVYQVNRAGKRSIYEKLTSVFTTSFHNNGTDFSFFDLRPGNCNDTAERRNSDIGNAKATMTNEYNGIINNDVEPFKTKMKDELQAQEIIIQ